MSWFDYGTPSKRSSRKNVRLRVKHLPISLVKRAKLHMRKDEIIDSVVVAQICPKGKVMLEFWCRKYGDYSKKDKTVVRYNVFQFDADEDPGWCCEGDVGRGYRE